MGATLFVTSSTSIAPKGRSYKSMRSPQATGHGPDGIQTHSRHGNAGSPNAMKSPFNNVSRWL
jgi:hypothetical protein